MTFAGNFLTEEMERQSRYNVVQIVVKTMTREPRQRYLKVKCTLFRTRLMAESRSSALDAIRLYKRIFFCHLPMDTIITPFL